eukprot:CAMPEP_0172417098 /NCGR_PEP_ID=MMETSP1064-20121228/3603_1 /TAXON_ID=202472 /ORGANISM="Aulacoseira subarctica , Strain CCAP 1002/5" /LENGTH=341 /DNA_ID=CAMNT_0013155199 /DNA_START=94 /DNA_END=1119 /DNA_ORIENTATION=+
MTLNNGRRKRNTAPIPKPWILITLFGVAMCYMVAQMHFWFTSVNQDFNGQSVAIAIPATPTNIHDRAAVSSKPAMPIKELSVIGERNSGTRWTFAHLTECFNGTGITVRDKLVRHKHWFQHDVPNGRERVGTAVVAVFRDPYYWVEAMRRVPHHSPLHYKLAWEDFVKTPWTMPRLPSEIKLKEDQPAGTTTSDIMCQEFFNYDQINSCQLKPHGEDFFADMSGHEPQYELRNDGSGRPYGSIIDLRSDKIKNHLSVAQWDWVQDYFQVRYEDLLQNGTDYMVKHVEMITGVKANCSPSPPQIRKKRKMINSYVSWMTKHVDWETEELIGYKPWSSNGPPY